MSLTETGQDGIGQAGITRWWISPLPRARVARLRTVLYLFIFVDVLLTTSWVADHADVPGQLYRPVLVARALSLPMPGPSVVHGVELALLVGAAVAASGRLPRLAGTTVFALYFEWMVIAFSYGKVDHDRFAFLVALAVLPTVGRVSGTDLRADRAAGWALRSIQMAVVVTYLLAAVAKFRFGGLAWLTSATLAWAVVRRGTFLADPLAQVPWVLQVAQWGIVAFELASPLLLMRGRVGKVMLGLAIAFHLVTYATITIIFLPHILCLLAFLPLERLRLPGHQRSSPLFVDANPAPALTTPEPRPATL
ncbi:MAG: HTTM domain-containing protein [Acidimicrobiales bacterium]